MFQLLKVASFRLYLKESKVSFLILFLCTAWWWLSVVVFWHVRIYVVLVLLHSSSPLWSYVDWWFVFVADSSCSVYKSDGVVMVLTYIEIFGLFVGIVVLKSCFDCLLLQERWTAAEQFTGDSWSCTDGMHKAVPVVWISVPGALHHWGELW